MPKNEFSCLSNALLRVSSQCVPSVMYEVPALVRKMVGDVDVHEVRTVTIHQYPSTNTITEYHLEVALCDGKIRTAEFLGAGSDRDLDTYILYSQVRDGAMKYLHLLH